MAKKGLPAPVHDDEDETGGKSKKKKKKKAKVSKVITLVMLVALSVSSPATLVMLAFTALPTLAAWFSERGKDKLAWICIGGLNFSGVIPFLFSLWFGVNTVEEALNMVSSGGVLFSAYVCSAIGWLIYRFVPPTIMRWLMMVSSRRSTALKAAQEKLIEEWGPEVAERESATEMARSG